MSQPFRAGLTFGARPYSGFPVELVGVGELHAAFLNESRTRGRIQRSVQEIRGIVKGDYAANDRRSTEI